MNMFSHVLAVLLLFVSSKTTTVFAQTQNLSCPRGEGVWINSEGVQSCRECPTSSIFLSQQPVKLPQNCTAHTFGVYLSMSVYTDFVEMRQRLKEADRFVERLNPLVNVLKQQLHTSNLVVERLQQSFDTLRLHNQRLVDNERLLKDSIDTLHTILYVTIGISALSLAYIAYTKN